MVQYFQVQNLLTTPQKTCTSRRPRDVGAMLPLFAMLLGSTATSTGCDLPGLRCADPCVTAGLSCSELATERERLRSLYLVAVGENDRTDMSCIGSCSRSVVAEQMSRPDRCGIDQCQDICEMEPCGTGEGTNCPDRCSETRELLQLTPGEMNEIQQRAAESPGVCTCNACGGPQGEFEFCEELWGCAAG